MLKLMGVVWVGFHKAHVPKTPTLNAQTLVSGSMYAAGLNLLCLPTVSVAVIVKQKFET